MSIVLKSEDGKFFSKNLGKTKHNIIKNYLTHINKKYGLDYGFSSLRCDWFPIQFNHYINGMSEYDSNAIKLLVLDSVFQLVDGELWLNFTFVCSPEYKDIVDELYEYTIKNKFKVGDWVINTNKNKNVGCSEVFEGCGHYQPFDYLDDFNPSHFRLATSEEIEYAKANY